MAKRDILKEAIADAKTVKETAIANAKAALEEAFTPRLKEMLATKLEEMDLDEEEEVLKEKKKYKDDDRKDGGESKETKRTEKMKYGKDLAESDIDEEIDLDEILAEIEEMDKRTSTKMPEQTPKKKAMKMVWKTKKKTWMTRTKKNSTWMICQMTTLKDSLKT